MKRFQPLMASAVVIVLGLIVIWFLRPGTEPEPSPDPLPPRANADQHEDRVEEEWVEAELAPRQTLDPSGMWPRANYRLAHPQVWVTWETGIQSPGRLLARGKRTPWYELGHTELRIHYLPLDLGVFDGEAEFMIEFEAFGSEWRSAAQPITYGAGVHFPQRRYRFELGLRGEHRFRMRVEGGDPTTLGPLAFRFRYLPDEVNPGIAPISGDEHGGYVYFVVPDSLVVPRPGCIGFLEVFDTHARTYDQVLIELLRE
jgi:hypothetical protein